MSADAEPEEIVRALFRHESRGPGSVAMVQIRELTEEEWDAAEAAHQQVHRLMRGFDQFLLYAWNDLSVARQHMLERGLAERDLDGGVLLEYRVLGFSTALKMYDEYVTAEVNRRGDDTVKAQVHALFSELYDTNRGYRLVYSLRNAFQHGVRGLLTYRGTVRLVNGVGPEREAELHGSIVKHVFAASGANATVRAEVRLMDDEPDVFVLCDEAYEGVQQLHARLTPILHPDAPAAAALLLAYMRENGNERAHFHKYRRGDEGHPTILTLDRQGFDFVVELGGYTPRYDDGRSSV